MGFVLQYVNMCIFLPTFSTYTHFSLIIHNLIHSSPHSIQHEFSPIYSAGARSVFLFSTPLLLSTTKIYGYS